MQNPGKPRDEHRGQPVPHFGQDHFEKSKLEQAARDRSPVDDAGAKVRESIEGQHGQPALLSGLGRGGSVHVEPQVGDAAEDLDGEPGVPRSG
jgi:hypothetical protein